jgi:integrase
MPILQVCIEVRTRSGGTLQAECDQELRGGARAARSAGLDPIGLHEARHTFASVLDAARLFVYVHTGRLAPRTHMRPYDGGDEPLA